MNTSGEHRRKPVFWIAFATMFAIFVYSGAWLVLDVLIKLGLTPQAPVMDTGAMQDRLSIWNVIAF